MPIGPNWTKPWSGLFFFGCGCPHLAVIYPPYLFQLDSSYSSYSDWYPVTPDAQLRVYTLMDSQISSLKLSKCLQNRFVQSKD
ncbi:hypothetical protein L208DRAFT_51439 [Tricholoma matsutake]|nr:hypothetical protein L208DRAFT_51439 [Tricholoma matsutake 945]